MLKNRMLVVVTFLFVMCAFLRVEAQEGMTVVAKDHIGFTVLQGGAEVLWSDTRIVGQGWDMPVALGMSEVEGGRRVFDKDIRFRRMKADAEPLRLRMEIEKTGPRQLTVLFRAKTDGAIELVGMGPVLPHMPAMEGGTFLFDTEDGPKTFSLPLRERGGGQGLKRVDLTLPGGDKISMRFEKSASYHLDRGEARLWVLSGKIAPGETVENKVIIDFPADITFEPKNRIPDMSRWFAYEGKQDFSPGSAIGMEDWLHKPAGKHGFVQIRDNKLVCEDGTPMVFWATNISWDDMAAPKEVSDEWADKFAKHGVNMVRMHKFINPGWAGIMDDNDSMKIVEEEAVLFDYMHEALRKRGTYSGWSPIFGYWLREADRDRVWAYDELMKMRDSGHFKGRTYGIVNIAPDLQDLNIQATVQMLNRVNVETGKRYADDPALAFVELQNEDDIFFFGIGNLVRKCPTYQKHISQEFCTWLKKEFASEEEIIKAWGALPRGESLADGTIFPFPNWWNPAEAPPQRVLDSYRFLFEYQNAYYQRYIDAIRATGYKGAIIGSCWQAADWLGHLYNLQSDRLAGFIDRHNYFKGSVPMVASPGSALLSAGMQQVADRPFALSEWAANHAFGAEQVPVIGVYGTGLQGWDMSAQFCSSLPGIRPHAWGGVNATCDLLMSISQYPAISRMLLRGDVLEGDVVASKRVSMQELHKGQLGYAEQFDISGDPNQKAFFGSVPQEAMGIGRIVIDFVDEPSPEPLKLKGIEEHLDREKQVVRSNTGQLKWDYSQRGYFTVNTPGTQAVIGFGGGQKHVLSDVVIEPQGLFANIYISADAPEQAIKNADRLLITTVARMVDEGAILDDLSMQALSSPTPPPLPNNPNARPAFFMAQKTLILEPVDATVTVKTDRAFSVFPLDHDGKMLAEAKAITVRKVEGGQAFELTGSETKAFYYVVEFNK